MGKGIESLPRRRPRRIVAAVAGALGACLLMFATGSLGAGQAGPPRFSTNFFTGGMVQEHGGFYTEAFSTRAAIVVYLEPELLATQWAASYSEHEGGPWTPANSSEIAAGQSAGSQLQIGAYDNESFGYLGAQPTFLLRHLKPGTSYYARFTGENADGHAEEVVPFETSPVEKPEIDNYYSGYQRFETTFRAGPTVPAVTDKSAEFMAKVDANGADTTYHFEYALGESGPWSEFTSGATGTITAGEEYKWARATLTGLKPETKYYVRLRAGNSAGETNQSTYYAGGAAGSSSYFTTGPARPTMYSAGVRNVTADSAFVDTGQVSPHGSETKWELEYAESESGPWSAVPGGSGTISQAEAEATPYGTSSRPSGARLTGLRASTEYFVRVSATNSCGEGCGRVTSAPASFTTEGAPRAAVYAAHGLDGESLRLLGSVDPNSVPTTAEQLIAVEGATGGTFKLILGGQETAGLPFDATSVEVQEAISRIQRYVQVEGAQGGPYTLSFTGEEAGKAQPLMVGDGSGLAGTGAKVSVIATFTGGEAYEAHYRFQYVSEKDFAEHGWDEAQESQQASAGSGGPRDVGYDLSALSEGEAYRYRLLVQSDAPGTGLVESGEGSFSVPVAPAATDGACPNEAYRTGASAELPDCRAYEQLTPAEKEGAQEPFHYGGGNLGNYGLAAETGGRFLFQAIGTDYLIGAGAGQGPYLFSRPEGGAWSMLAGTAQPEAGVQFYEPQVYSADLTEVAAAADARTSEANASEVQYKVGPVGGPYTSVTAIARKFANSEEGWVAGDPSLSKLVLATSDHEQLGAPTGTRQGSDLYEYTQADGLVQLNVAGEPAVTIGSCGARIVHGLEDGAVEQIGGTRDGSSPHSISSDGSRVFFEADPGKRCGEETSHLYMRVDGSETVDLGAYRFCAANAEGTELLLEGQGGAEEPVLYETETGQVTPLPGLEGFSAGSSEVVVASDLSAVYRAAHGSLERYDLVAGRAEQLFPLIPGSEGLELTVTPDGRYAYFHGSVGALPGGGQIGKGVPHEDSRGDAGQEATQLYRYDSQEHAVECISCASPSDPEPRLPAFLYNSSSAHPLINGGAPLDVSVSGNGRYAFFTTPAALVQNDRDGEVGVESCVNGPSGGLENCEYGDVGTQTSPSSDIYEWRASGVNGCVQLNGCVALISGGHGGYKTLLLGSSDEGRDVYIYTREQLSPQDRDTAGDVYDARVEGTPTPPAVRPTECEANSCAIPPSAPLDLTPASLAFTGIGNVTPLATPAKTSVKAKPKPKPKAKHRGKRCKHRKAGRRKARKEGRRTVAGSAHARCGRGL